MWWLPSSRRTNSRWRTPPGPETDAFAKQMAELSDGSPTFANYDLIHEDSA